MAENSDLMGSAEKWLKGLLPDWARGFFDNKSTSAAQDQNKDKSEQDDASKDSPKSDVTADDEGGIMGFLNTAKKWLKRIEEWLKVATDFITGDYADMPGDIGTALKGTFSDGDAESIGGKKRGFVGRAIDGVKNWIAPPATKEIITDAATKHGLNPNTLLTLSKVESDWLNTAVSSTGAVGLFQFVPGTAAAYNLWNRHDPAASANAAAQYWNDNRKEMARLLGRNESDVSDAENYLAYQQGATGATALLKNPNMTAWQALMTTGRSEARAKEAITANGGDLDMTANEFASGFINKWNSYSEHVAAANTLQPMPSGDKTEVAENRPPVIQPQPVQSAQPKSGHSYASLRVVPLSDASSAGSAPANAGPGKKKPQSVPNPVADVPAQG